MKITRESTGPLTAILHMEVAPEDYAASVEKQITEFKRKTNLPGFRPGHIPTGLVKKMYGKAILADEVNKLISENLSTYIHDEKLNILGNPIPNMEKNEAIDFEHQDEFHFYFDLGFAPDFTIPTDQDLGIKKYLITVDDDMVEKYITDTRKRFGTPVVTETGTVAENETVTSDGDAKEPEVEPAEMNPAFFNMVYPGLDLQTEEDFRIQVRKDAEGSFSAETDKLLFGDITDALVKHTEMALPDEFLKRWLLENNEGKYDPEYIEQHYTSFAESMKWQLIENRLIRENDIRVTDEEIRNYIGTYMLRMANLQDVDDEMRKRYESVIDTLMQNKEQVQRINDQLYNAKLMDYFKSHITFHPEEIGYDAYIKLVSEKHAHDHQHEHHHDHDHAHDHDHDHEHDHHH